MRSTVILLCTMLAGLQARAAAVETTLSNALADKDIIVSLRALGGYCGKGLELSVRNISCREYHIAVDPGLIFHPVNASYQDLVIAGGQQLVLKPETQQALQVQTFCAKSYAMGPEAGLRYTFLRKADAGLLNVLAYISAHGHNNYLGQSAVWCFTNNHPPAGIYDRRFPESSKALAAFVAKQKGLPAPRYFTVYKRPAAGGAVFQPVRDKVVVELRWTAEPRNVTASIYNEDGTVYRRVAGTEYISKEGHRMHVEFNLKQVLPGKYLVKIRDDENYVYASQEVLID